VAEVKCLVFEVRRLHLDREVIDAETIVQLRAQLAQQIGLRDAVRVNHVRAERVTAGRDRPNVQVVHVIDTMRRQDRILNRREIDV